MGMPSLPEMAMILAIVLVLFGSKRIRNLGGDLGHAIKGFKEGFTETAELREDIIREVDDVKATIRQGERV